MLTTPPLLGQAVLSIEYLSQFLIALVYSTRQRFMVLYCTTSSSVLILCSVLENQMAKTGSLEVFFPTGTQGK